MRQLETTAPPFFDKCIEKNSCQSEIYDFHYLHYDDILHVYKDVLGICGDSKMRYNMNCLRF